MAKLLNGEIDAFGLLSSVRSEARGATLVFYGSTRNTPGERPVVALNYEAHEVLATQVLKAIEQEVPVKWPNVRAAVAHRLGRVDAGDVSVVVATAGPHRLECYEASQYAINELKRRAPIWKKEIYEDGSAWKANATAKAD